MVHVSILHGDIFDHCIFNWPEPCTHPGWCDQQQLENRDFQKWIFSWFRPRQVLLTCFWHFHNHLLSGQLFVNTHWHAMIFYGINWICIFQNPLLSNAGINLPDPQRTSAVPPGLYTRPAFCLEPSDSGWCPAMKRTICFTIVSSLRRQEVEGLSHHITLHNTLHYTTQHTALHHTTHCITPHNTLHYTTQHTALHHTTHCITPHNTLHYTTQHDGV